MSNQLKQAERGVKQIRDVIYAKDCSRMDELADGTVDLVISGPPYWDFIDYAAFNRGEDFVWKGNKPYENYLQDLETWHRECYRVLRAGRFCVINLATMSRGPATFAIPFHAVPIIEKLGFRFCFEIIWHKVSGGRARARNFVRRPYPGNFVPNIRTEYLLVFRKPPFIKLSPGLGRLNDPLHRIEVDEYFVRETANNVWHIPPAGKSGNPHKRPRHPCPFPSEIPLRLIKLFSLPGETVLDPFMGVGTTAKAAIFLGRHFVGYEIEPAFVQMAIEELSRPLKPRPGIYCTYQKQRPVSRKEK